MPSLRARQKKSIETGRSNAIPVSNKTKSASRRARLAVKKQAFN
jgi:hypothetical protein